MDENEAAYLSWFYSKKLDSEWNMELTDKQKKELEDKGILLDKENVA